MPTPIQYDFRSDTVTRPGAAMRAAMAAAEVGDDVYGDDPSVNLLEASLAERFGKAAAVMFPTGTQSNLVALMAHCERGDEYIVGQNAHCYRMEAGGAAVLGSIQPQPIVNQPDGTLLLTDIEAAIKPDDSHFARSRLLALENTIGGRVLPQDYVRAATTLARDHGLSCHLDGARVFNAAVRSGLSVDSLAKPFDSVSVCLSKGLGAPLGSVLVGDRAVIDRARRLRKMVGGGMRQAGVIAAACLYALEHHVDRLADDHANARTLAEGLARLPALQVTMPDTNIVFVKVAPDVAEAFSAYLSEHGVGLTSAYAATQQRWVTHLDVSAQDVTTALEVATSFFQCR